MNMQYIKLAIPILVIGMAVTSIISISIGNAFAIIRVANHVTITAANQTATAANQTATAANVTK
jgi:hypothetical protein